jgi:hypothetical protein
MVRLYCVFILESTMDGRWYVPCDILEESPDSAVSRKRAESWCPAQAGAERSDGGEQRPFGLLLAIKGP